MAGNTTTRDYSWTDLVLRANPDHYRESRFVVEYEFTALGRGGDERTHESGKRVFRGYYQTRGAYVPDTVGTFDLTWGGIPIMWDGDPLTWGDA